MREGGFEPDEKFVVLSQNTLPLRPFGNVFEDTAVPPCSVVAVVPPLMLQELERKLEGFSLSDICVREPSFWTHVPPDGLQKNAPNLLLVRHSRWSGLQFLSAVARGILGPTEASAVSERCSGAAQGLAPTKARRARQLPQPQ